jgi:DNA primase
MLSILADDPAASPAKIVSSASVANPRAAGILTSANTSTGEDPAQSAAFLVEELAIGDMEESLAEMNEELRTGTNMDEDDRNLIFQAAVDLQKSIAALRNGHAAKIAHSIE